MSDDDEEDPHGLSRREDPPSSHEAGSDVPAKKLFGIIYRLLLRFPHYKNKAGVWIGGLTNSEVSFYTGLHWNTCTPRMRQMANRGWITELKEGNELVYRVPLEFGGKKKQIIWIPIIKKEEEHVEQDRSRGPRLGGMAGHPQRTPDSLPLFRFYNTEEP